MKHDEKKPKPSYYSVIPADVRYCKALGNASPRDLYGEITALCNKHGFCFASNGYFAELYEVDPRTIRRWIALLVSEGFVHVQAGKLRKLFLANAPKVDLAGLAEPEEYEVESQPEAPAPKEKKKPAAKKATAKVLKQKFTAVDLELAEYLRSRILYNFPEIAGRKVVIEDWADDIRKLRTLNNKGEPLENEITPYTIRYMITWVHGGDLILEHSMKRHHFEPHDFWHQNILSANKLRKQWYDNLVPKAKIGLVEKVKKNVSADLSNPAGRRAPVPSRNQSAKL